jgi:hypothetical protein
MIRIFGKSRKELLNARKFRKYLAYAAGEIILVVVGILIALQFNSADLDRQDRKKEKDFMVSMLGDLEKDVREIDIAVAGNRVLLNGLDELLQQIAQKPQSLEEQRRLYLWSLKNTYWYFTAEFSEGTLSQLKYSGGFQLVEKESVLDAILRYDQGLDRCSHQEEELVRYFHVVEARQKDLFDLSLGKKAFEFIEQDVRNMLLPAEQFQDLIEEGVYLVDSAPETLTAYYADVLYYRTTINNTNAAYAAQKDLAGSLSQLIRDNHDIE